MEKKKRWQIYKAMAKKEGTNSRVAKVIEELSELSAELSKIFQYDGYNIQKLCDEIADVKVSLEQLEYIFAPNLSIIDTIVDFKLKRTEAFYIDIEDSPGYIDEEDIEEIDT